MVAGLGGADKLDTSDLRDFACMRQIEHSAFGTADGPGPSPDPDDLSPELEPIPTTKEGFKELQQKRADRPRKSMGYRAAPPAGAFSHHSMSQYMQGQQGNGQTVIAPLPHQSAPPQPYAAGPMGGFPMGGAPPGGMPSPSLDATSGLNPFATPAMNEDDRAKSAFELAFTNLAGASSAEIAKVVKCHQVTTNKQTNQSSLAYTSVN